MNIFEFGLSATPINVSFVVEQIYVNNSNTSVEAKIVHEYHVSADLMIEKNMTKGSSSLLFYASAIGRFPETPIIVRH